VRRLVVRHGVVRARTLRRLDLRDDVLRLARHQPDLEPRMPLLHAIREPPVGLLELAAVGDDDQLAVLGLRGPAPGQDERRAAGEASRECPAGEATDPRPGR
jgi:hypothetical protein